MSKSTTAGFFIGAVLVGVTGYQLWRMKVISIVPKSTMGKFEAAVNEPANAPLVHALPDRDLDFSGNADMIERRARLKPQLTVASWDRVAASAKIAAVTATEGCSVLDSTQAAKANAIFVSAATADSIAKGSTNIIFLNRNLPRCFNLNSTVGLGIDEPSAARTLYRIAGEVTIDRIADLLDLETHKVFLEELAINASDALYLASEDLTPLRQFQEVTALLVTFKPAVAKSENVNASTPASAVIPTYVPGAEALPAAAFATLTSKSKIPLGKLVLVDARDRRHLEAGPPYNGAISAAFVASDPEQLKFRPDIPVSILAGARFETGDLPRSRDIPLVVFGNDEYDATPLWVIRNLRLQNYRNIFYVTGGLKAMKELKQPLAF